MLAERPTARSAEKQSTVLFVDDDPTFLETVRDLMATLSQGRWEILTAGNASEAFQLLQRHAVDLVVLDVEMQAIDGVQVLSLLNRSHPQLQKAVLTGYATDNYRAACLAQGAELFLRKPTDPEGWASIHAALQQLLDFPPERGFRGVLRRVGLAEVLQMECLGRSNSLLEVVAGNRKGRIYVEQGQIVHAELGPYTGESAFQRILALPGGQFVVHPLQEVPQRTIQNSWEFLLMEAARVHDELQAEMAGHSAVGSVAAPEVQDDHPMVTCATSSEPTAESKQGVRHVVVDLEDRPTGMPPVTPEPQRRAEEAQATPPALAREVLICDESGSVLYEWDCPDRAAWVNIMEFVSQKARRLTPSREFGAFDRLEMVTAQSRRVILLRPGRAIMLAFGPPEANPGLKRQSDPSPLPPERWAAWLRGLPPQPGVVLRAIRFSNRTVVVDVESRDLSSAWLDYAGRTVLDAYEVLLAHRVYPERLRWRYEASTIDCARNLYGDVMLVLSRTGDVHATPDLLRVLSAFGRAVQTEIQPLEQP